MKQTYQEFLEESTNTVKAKRGLSKTILLATCFIAWIAAMLAFWLAKGPETAALDVAFRWCLLPMLLFAVTAAAAKNDYWGRGKWFCVPAAAIAFLTIPHTQWIQQGDTVAFSFRFPNFPYMAVGVAVAVCGLAAGMLWRKLAAKRTKK